MAGENERNLRHLTITGRTEGISYTHPRGGGGGSDFPARDRAEHAARLTRQLDSIRQQAIAQRDERIAVGLPTDYGLVLEFESKAGYPLKSESLDRTGKHISLLNIRTRRVEVAPGDFRLQELASVRIPFGQLQVFEGMIADYRTENTPKKGQPVNQPFLNPIQEIRLAALDAFWNEPNPLPASGLNVPWEAWLHFGETPDARVEVLARFRAAAATKEIAVLGEPLDLPETTVILIRATREQLQSSIELLDCLRELRAPAEGASVFDGMEVGEQADWVQSLRDRLLPPEPTANAVCLLDTGVNHGHPLLTAVMPADGLQAFDPAWGTHDQHQGGRGHGTQMAGLAAHGDLVAPLSGNAPVVASHWVESVKSLNDRAPQAQDQWGNVIRRSIASIEQASPFRRRVFSQQISALGICFDGRPTSWSSATDQLCVAYGEDPADPRLLLICAGNAPANSASRYPAANRNWSIHDPAQAWNALTVGACTHKDRIIDPPAAQFAVAAPRGGLSPISSTSGAWDPDWPIKPDIVMEGGNRYKDQGTLWKHPDLELLTTAAQFNQRLLCTADGTSAATVQAARLAAMVQREYPDFWPETIRALMTHSAEWTPAMLDNRPLARLDKTEVAEVLRQFGHGEPGLDRALRTAKSAVTLIVQDNFQPFLLEESSVKTNEMRFHELPWPKEALEAIGEASVELRVTLSYFIEPNPGPRLTNNRYRYGSCHLRFEIQRPLETPAAFKARINQENRTTDYAGARGGDSDQWLIGSDTRHRGSIHQDTWYGTAADLASKPNIVVYPVSGWWRLRKHLGRHASRVRYALVVSLRSPNQGIDLYTPIVNQIALTVQNPRPT